MEFVTTLLRDAVPYLHLQSVLGRAALAASFVLMIFLIFRNRAIYPIWRPAKGYLLLIFTVIGAAAVLFLFPP